MRTRSGIDIKHFIKEQRTLHPSVQGAWTPIENEDYPTVDFLALEDNDELEQKLRPISSQRNISERILESWIKERDENVDESFSNKVTRMARFYPNVRLDEGEEKGGG